MKQRHDFDANEIAPGLWMGSKPMPGASLRSRGFHVLTLCALEHQPSAEWFPGIELARIFLDDAELPGAQALQASALGAQLAKAIKHGARVLVTCRQGRNRSGLVTALALTHLTGCSGVEAVRAVTSRRHSPFGPTLSNDHYVRALVEIPAMDVRGVQTRNAARAARLAG